MEVLKRLSPIETYTALYIKAVRIRGYNKSLYSFLQIYGESPAMLKKAQRIMQGFIKTGLMYRKEGTRECYWNKSGRYILAEGIHEFVKECLYSAPNFSRAPYVYTNKQMEFREIRENM